MESNIQQYFAEFSKNSASLSRLNLEKRTIARKQVELEAQIVDCLTRMQAGAVQYQDQIFSVVEKTREQPINTKKLKEVLVKMGVASIVDIERAIALRTRPPVISSRVVLTKKSGLK